MSKRESGRASSRVKVNRREFIGGALAGGLISVSGAFGSESGNSHAFRSKSRRFPINREILVNRHNPTLRRLDPAAPFSLGNGEFAFTADITGLQTFSHEY